MASGSPPIVSVIAAATFSGAYPSGRCTSSTNLDDRSTSVPIAG